MSTPETNFRPYARYTAATIPGMMEVSSRDPHLTQEEIETIAVVEQIQTEMGKFRHGDITDNPYPGQVSYYDEQLRRRSDDFVGLLISDEIQNNLDKVNIGPQGFRLILQSLDNGIAPDHDTMAGLAEVLQVQDLDAGNPVVARVLEKFTPDAWKLSDEQKDHYRKILDLKELKKPEKIEPPKQSFRERFMRGSHAYAPTLVLPDASPEGKLSEDVKEWWLKSNERQRVTPPKVKKDDQYILKLAKKDAQRRLKLDAEASKI